MSALFLGRFQPFHLGHLQVIKHALKEHTDLTIVIGSTEENFLPTDPLTVSERIQILEAALQEAKINRAKYRIIPVPNINNYALWPRHVELNVPPFTTIYTGSDIVESLFQTYNQTLKKPYKIIKVSKELNICATTIREKMLNNQPWEKLTTKATTKLLKDWKIPERLKTIHQTKKQH